VKSLLLLKGRRSAPELVASLEAAAQMRVYDYIAVKKQPSWQFIKREWHGARSKSYAFGSGFGCLCARRLKRLIPTISVVDECHAC